MSLSKSMCGLFKRNCLGLKSFFHRLHPGWFLQPEVMGFICLALEPYAGQPGVGLGLLATKISLPNFYPSHMDVGLAHSVSLSLLPVWIDMVSFNSVIVRLPFNSISDNTE